VEKETSLTFGARPTSTLVG